MDSRNVFRAAGELAGDIFSPISSRLGRIDPKLKAAVRKYTFQHGLTAQRDRAAILPFLDGVAKMDVGDYRMLDFALKNRDQVKVDELLKKYGLEKEFQAVRDVLDAIHTEATDVGMDLGYIQDYFPRMVRLTSATDYMNAIRDRADWSDISEALKQADPLGAYTDEERAVFVNNYLRGYESNRTNLSKPSFTKDRVIDYVNPAYNKFYHPSPEALLHYISAMRLGIEQRKLFGKGDTAEESIGKYVLSMIDQGVITHEEEAEVKKILGALINQRGPGAFVSWLKNGSYIYLMGSPISAITQIGDLAFSLAKNGYYRTGVSLAKSLVNKPLLTKEDLGIDNIAHEFESKSRSSNAVRLVFKAVGLSWMDNIGKQVFVESAYKRLRKEAKANKPKFQKMMQEIFGEEAKAARNDLLEGNLTDNVKMLLYSELSTFQPVSLAEMPVGYLRGGNLRAFYMLKTYTIKQIDAYRTQVFDKIASAIAMK